MRHLLANYARSLNVSEPEPSRPRSGRRPLRLLRSVTGCQWSTIPALRTQRREADGRALTLDVMAYLASGKSGSGLSCWSFFSAATFTVQPVEFVVAVGAPSRTAGSRLHHRCTYSGNCRRAGMGTASCRSDDPYCPFGCAQGYREAAIAHGIGDLLFFYQIIYVLHVRRIPISLVVKTIQHVIDVLDRLLLLG